MTTLMVVAKEPIAGRVKTRLHPPFSLVQAAQLAAAAPGNSSRAGQEKAYGGEDFGERHR